MKKLSYLFLLVVLALGVVPAAFAQDTLNASQEDYDLWTSANETTAAVQTLSYGLTVNVNVSGMGDSNVTVDLAGSGVLDTNPDAPQFQLAVTGTGVQGTETTPINAELRVVDGIAYYNENGEGWKGQPAEDLMGSLSGMSGGAVDPNALAGGDLSGLSNNPMIGDLMTSLGGLQPSEFMTLTSADEGGLKNLTVTIDVPKLIGSPAVAPLFGTVMSMGSTDAPAMTDAQLQQMQAMFAGVFSTAEISLSELIDPATQLVQSVTLHISIPLDAVVGPGALVAGDITLNLSNFDQPVTVEAPADVEMIDPSAGG